MSSTTTLVSPNDGPPLDSVMMKSDADYLILDDLLTPQQKKIRYKARKFAENDIAPMAAAAFESAGYKYNQFASLRKLGLGGGYLQGYGCKGLDLMSFAMVCMELFRVDAALGAFYMIHNAISMPSILYCGSEKQKQFFLPKMASMDLLCSFGLTESKIGSDAAHLTTTCEKVNRNGKIGWVLNGNKRWIGGGSFCDVNVVWARVKSNGPDNGKVHGFLVLKGVPGFVGKKIENKIALRGMINADMTFTDCFVPEELRLAGCTDFRTGPGRILVASRVMASWAAIGLAIASYDGTVSYCKARKQFGSPISHFQLVQSQLVEMLAQIQACIYMTFRVTQLLEQNRMTAGQSALVKAFVSKTCRKVVRTGRDLMGGNGILGSHRVGRAFLDIEAVYTFEGAYNINQLLCGREITGFNAFKAPTRPTRSIREIDNSSNTNNSRIVDRKNSWPAPKPQIDDQTLIGRYVSRYPRL